MRKRINGKVYDTQTAIKICEISNGEDFFSPFFESKTLLRTRAGNYFLLGECGYLSAFAKNSSTKGGSLTINAITNEEAKKWLVKYGTEEDLKKIK